MKSVIQKLSQVSIDPNDLEIPKVNPDDSNSLATALELVIGMAAAAAFLVVIVAGLMFVLAQDDPAKATKARNAIIYAAVGLVTALMAFAIVRFVVRSV